MVIYFQSGVSSEWRMVKAQFLPMVLWLLTTLALTTYDDHFNTHYACHYLLHEVMVNCGEECFTCIQIVLSPLPRTTQGIFNMESTSIITHRPKIFT